MKSIGGQDHPDHHTILVCNEVPEFCSTLEKTTVLSTDIGYEGEFDHSQGRIDKQRKCMKALLEARDTNPEFGMIVDADDLVHRQLVSYALENTEFGGFLLSRGYRHNLGQDCLRKSLSFHKACGSSIIFPYRKEDLEDCQSGDDFMKHFMTKIAHNTRIEDDFDRLGIRYRSIPFYAGIYTRGYGDSLRELDDQKKSKPPEQAGGDKTQKRLRIWCKRLRYKMPGWILGSQRIDDQVRAHFPGLDIGGKLRA